MEVSAAWRGCFVCT